MALIRLDRVPETVQLNLPLYVVIPDPAKIGRLPLRKRKLLYLLHGLGDDARHDWPFWHAQIQRFLAAVLGPQAVK